MIPSLNDHMYGEIQLLGLLLEREGGAFVVGGGQSDKLQCGMTGRKVFVLLIYFKRDLSYVLFASEVIWYTFFLNAISSFGCSHMPISITKRISDTVFSQPLAQK